MTKEQLEAFNASIKTLREKVDQRDEEIKKLGEAKAETDVQIKTLTEQVNGFEAKANAMETKHNRVQTHSEADQKQEEGKVERKAAFDKFCRKGRTELNPEEVKLLTTSDDAQAGYLAPAEYASEVIKGVEEFSPIRTIARVYSTSAKRVEFPKRTGVLSATWAGDAVTVTNSEPTYGLEAIDANTLMSVSKVTNEMLEDSAFNLAEFLQADMAEQFGVSEGTAFVSGNGVKRPEGFMTSADVGSVNGGAASTLTADGIIKLAFEPKTAYAAVGTFVLNRNTLEEVYKLKDGQGQYLYRPNQETGKAPTIQGKPYLECVDMPDIGANTYPIAFGDFRRGFMIVDRLQIAVVRDDTTLAEQDTVRFIGRKRVGGQVVLAEAIKKLKISV